MCIMAIVNTEPSERYATIPEAEREIVEALLANSPPSAEHEPAVARAAADWRRQDQRERAAIHAFHVPRVSEHSRSATKG